jgi:hypothetical protein
MVDAKHLSMQGQIGRTEKTHSTWSRRWDGHACQNNATAKLQNEGAQAKTRIPELKMEQKDKSDDRIHLTEEEVGRRTSRNKQRRAAAAWQGKRALEPDEVFGKGKRALEPEQARERQPALMKEGGRGKAMQKRLTKRWRRKSKKKGARAGTTRTRN